MTLKRAKRIKSRCKLRPDRQNRAKGVRAADGPNSRIRIRTAEAADLDGLVRLETCFDAAVAISRRQFRYLLSRKTAQIWVIRENRRVVADLVLLRRNTPRGLLGRLYSVVVDPEQRGKGYGRALVRFCLRQLHREGAYAVVLEVHPHNESAIRLYLDEGFRELALLRDYYAPGEHAQKLQLVLKR